MTIHEHKYVVVKSVDLTTDMKNRAVRPWKSVVVSIDILGIPTDHNIVEVAIDELVHTTVFDGYTWYTPDEAKTIKDTGDWP